MRRQLCIDFEVSVSLCRELTWVGDMSVMLVLGRARKAAVNTYAAFERFALEERLARKACPAAVSAAAVGGVLAG